MYEGRLLIVIEFLEGSMLKQRIGGALGWMDARYLHRNPVSLESENEADIPNLTCDLRLHFRDNRREWGFQDGQCGGRRCARSGVGERSGSANNRP